MTKNEADCRIDLPRRVGGVAERTRARHITVHCRIALGMAEALEVQAPDIEARAVQRVAPGSTVEAMGNRECRRKRGAMDVEHRTSTALKGGGGREMSQEQLGAVVRSLDEEMLFTIVELGQIRAHGSLLRCLADSM